MIETPRLILRRFRDDDLDAYAAIMGDPAVAAWLPGVETRELAAAQMARMDSHWDRRGFGPVALELKATGALVGGSGLNAFDARYDATPVSGGVEIAWRLAPSAWGLGLASEAAQAVLADGFANHGLAEVIAITAVSNARSRAVMERLGFSRRADQDFDHPSLAPDHPLRPHVVYAITSVAFTTVKTAAPD